MDGTTLFVRTYVDYVLVDYRVRSTTQHTKYEITHLSLDTPHTVARLTSLPPRTLASRYTSIINSCLLVRTHGISPYARFALCALAFLPDALQLRKVRRFCGTVVYNVRTYVTEKERFGCRDPHSRDALTKRCETGTPYRRQTLSYVRTRILPSRLCDVLGH